MPNKLTVGEIYRAERTRSGESARGPWELISLKDAKRQNEITIFPTNIPTGVTEKGQFRIKKIISLTNGKKKDQNGNWAVNVTCEAEVEAIGTDIPGFAADVPGITVDADNVWSSADVSSVTTPWDDEDYSLPL